MDGFIAAALWMDDWALYEGISGIGVLGLGLAILPVCEYHVIIDNTLYVIMKSVLKIFLFGCFLV